LPTDRRTIYALLFLTGGRVGEISALKWSVYDTQAFPLGAMVIAFSYDSAGRKVKGTKTEVTREVPVHPVLAHLLSEWRSTGWEAMMGRPPTADDLIVPDRPDGLNRKKSHFPFRAANLVYKAMLRDLELLGLRKRRIHDARRTFVSVCMDAGMNKDIVQRFTHVSQNEQSAFGLYNSPLWRRQCEEMLRLDLSEVLDGELGRIVTASVTGLIRPRNREGNRVGARGFEPLKHPISLNEPEVDSVDFTHGGTSSNAVELVAVEPACHSAVTARPGDFPETLQSLVEGVRAKDRRAVRRALLELLQKLDED
jgi:hypothetical protein